MPKVYLKEADNPSRTEVAVESVEDLAVKDFRATVSEKLDIPLEELFVVYAGRVLKPSQTLGYYQVTNGCTIHVLRKKKLKEEELEGLPQGGFGSIISNRRIQRVIGRMLSNPSLIRAVTAGTPLAGSSALQETMSNPDLLSALSDPDTISDYFRNHPEMAIMMEGILRIYGLLFGGARDMDLDDEGDFVDMVEGNLEEDMELVQEENIRRRANAQEQMFEHSQALLAHRQQQQRAEPSTTTPSSETPVQPVEASSFQPSTAQQHASITVEPQQSQSVNTSSGGGGGVITHDLLTTALAGAMGSTQNSAQPSPLSSLDFSTVVASSGPSSLSVEQPLSRQHSQGGEGLPERSEEVGTVTREGGTITSEALQHALTSAMSTLQPSQQQQQQQHPLSPHDEELHRNLAPSDRYRAQLEQLHVMGVTDDATCLHALEATKGDLQAALELLMGTGNP